MGLTLSRRVWLLLGATALIVIALLYLNSRRPVQRVSVVQVVLGNLSSSITTNGKVEPITPYALRAKFDGFVGHVSAVEGQTVKAGQLLLVLNDEDVQAQLDQAKAQLASEEDDLRDAEGGGRSDQVARLAGDLHTAEAQRNLLQQKNDALAKLVPEKAATPEELQTNQADLEHANAQVEQAQKAKQEFERQVQSDRERLTLLVAHSRAEVTTLQDKVNSARVVAPVSGTLYSLPAHERDFVHVGDLLANVADLTRVRVRAYVDEPELGQLMPNQEVDVTWSALPERTWTGRTESIPRQVVPRGARNVGEVLCSVSNDKMELIPDTTVDVRIKLSERSNVLIVPRGAVQIDGVHRYIYLVTGGRLRRREIRAGLSNATQFEVLFGTQVGDKVALPGTVPLRDNTVVQVQNPG
jgi:HlyD family secretion protein